MKITYTRYEGMNKENKGYYDFQAIENGKSVGTGTLQDCDPILGIKVFTLTSLNVAKGYQHKGIGTKLQEAREKLAKELGAKYVILWTDKSMWMKEWYERRGYREHDGRNDKNYWMYKKL